MAVAVAVLVAAAVLLRRQHPADPQCQALRVLQTFPRGLFARRELTKSVGTATRHAGTRRDNGDFVRTDLSA